MSPEVYRDGQVHVRASKCDHCLYSKDRIVSGQRARQLTTDTRALEGSAFICHKSQVSDEGEAICFAWFDNFAREDAVLRLALAMGVVVYDEAIGREK